MDRKKLIWMVLFLILAVLTVYAIVSQSQSFSVDKMYNDLLNARVEWIVMVLLCMVGFIGFEAAALKSIVKGLCGEGKRVGSILYAASDIYFSAITPSATGGQPASAFFMLRDGIPGPVVTVALILNLIMYTIALVAIGIFGVLTRPTIIGDFGVLSRIIILAGLLVLVALIFVFFLLLKKEKIVYSIADFFLKIGGKMHLVKHPEKKRDKLHKTSAEYKEAVEVAHGKGGMLFKAFIFNLLQRVSSIGVTLCMYMATGGKLSNALDVWVIQSFTTIGANCVPIPGAMGVADYLLIDGFKAVPDVASPANLELLSRGMSFYCMIVISAGVTLVGYIVQRHRIKKSK